MQGRATGNQERIIILAHQMESMARQERLRPLRHYLHKGQQTKTDGAMSVLAMLRAMKEKQDRAAG